ncbi:hypothetical protein GpartN1_g4860.t1 [Galdieria partita]|uniref:Uncharacterized protein n=1 Tax=Galdieria partita TaxID=83374 RepID=A0A9C7PZL5_9RHOD|nr:hypothetical protein GpartN1_g1893.t1 [Galdieria partita]GJQ13069.1 hypothetical protein GpartN1_g4860.t1 [Galdieria partita]
MEVCQSVLELQEHRAVCYNTLEQAFQALLRNQITQSSVEEYMRTCQQIKKLLHSLDERLANLKLSVSCDHCVYENIEHLEQLERCKLEATVSVQKIRKDMKLFKDRLDTLELAEQQSLLRRQYLILSQVMEDIEFLLMEFRNENKLSDKTE